MASLRFNFSPFRNATLKEGHREQWTSLSSLNQSVGDNFVRVASDSKGNSVVRVAASSIAKVAASNSNGKVESIATSGDVEDIGVGVGGVLVAGAAAALSVYSTQSNTWTSTTTQASLVETHPFVALAATASTDALSLVDLNPLKLCLSLQNNAIVQSLAFSSTGALLATSNKDNVIRIFDPRASNAPTLLSTVHHAGVKPTRLVWLNNEYSLLSAGFSKMRDRELAVWDVRAFGKGPVHNLKVDTGTGVMLPLFDGDSGLLFLVGKGDSVVRSFEFGGNGITQTPTTFNSSIQIQGACLSSKWALDVMDCQVDRLMVVGKAAQAGASDVLVPVGVGVARKNKMDFQDDLFPPTYVDVASQSVDDWFKGTNAFPAKASLNPKARASTSAIPVLQSSTNPALSQQSSFVSPSSTTRTSAAATPAPGPVPATTSYRSSTSTAASPFTAPAAPLPGPIPSTSKPPTTTTAETLPTTHQRSISPPTSPKQALKLPAQSSFKYIQGTPTKHLEDLRQSPPTVPNESRLLDTNTLYVAFPVSGGGGRVAVWPHSRSGRVPVKIPCVVGGSDVTDFAFHQENQSTLYTAHEDGGLRVWEIQESMFVEPKKGESLQDVTNPIKTVKVNGGKCGFLVIHPFIDGFAIVSSAEPGNYVVKGVDVKSGEVVWSCVHPELVFGAAFSPCGEKVVSVCKDGKVRVVELRTGKVLGETVGHEGSKGARVSWVGGTDWFLSCGFGRANQREMRVYNSKNLTQTAFVTTEMSPSLITPYVDESLPIVYLVGKGESYIQIFHIEFNEGDGGGVKALTKVANYTSPGPQMATSFVSKLALNVKEVEIAKCYRLTSNSIEQVSFKLPRLKKEYFQDDLYPPVAIPTKTTFPEWKESTGSVVASQVIDLCPAGMTPLSTTKGTSTPTQVRSSVTVAVELSEAAKKQAAIEQMKRLAMADDDEKMEQDKFEGVADDEWD
ncbi:UNVERIFIED_CONTAM: Coronin-7 [Siphonaria sp. JEL0065]|nr:Coronin-7 [Siphonaria sp. JEL0065]